MITQQGGLKSLSNIPVNKKTFFFSQVVTYKKNPRVNAM
jgi:hypothetical protein